MFININRCIWCIQTYLITRDVIVVALTNTSIIKSSSDLTSCKIIRCYVIDNIGFIDLYVACHIKLRKQLYLKMEMILWFKVWRFWKGIRVHKYYNWKNAVNSRLNSEESHSNRSNGLVRAFFWFEDHSCLIFSQGRRIPY